MQKQPEFIEVTGKQLEPLVRSGSIVHKGGLVLSWSGKGFGQITMLHKDRDIVEVETEYSDLDFVLEAIAQYVNDGKPETEEETVESLEDNYQYQCGYRDFQEEREPRHYGRSYIKGFEAAKSRRNPYYPGGKQ